mmetsp:Transcript_54015/g.161693  ORF Transcript_54015/g.161693 Transcript_54015/m.161693 type:complete len:319 (+) Transcript_54015:1889-2845(+)
MDRIGLQSHTPMADTANLNIWRTLGASELSTFGSTTFVWTSSSSITSNKTDPGGRSVATASSATIPLLTGPTGFSITSSKNKLSPMSDCTESTSDDDTTAGKPARAWASSVSADAIASSTTSSKKTLPCVTLGRSNASESTPARDDAVAAAAAAAMAAISSPAVSTTLAAAIFFSSASSTTGENKSSSRGSKVGAYPPPAVSLRAMLDPAPDPISTAFSCTDEGRLLLSDGSSMCSRRRRGALAPAANLLRDKRIDGDARGDTTKASATPPNVAANKAIDAIAFLPSGLRRLIEVADGVAMVTNVVVGVSSIGERKQV